MDNQEKVKENYLRRAATRQGFILKKSKAKKWNVDNYQGWQIVDAQRNIIVAGEKFDMTLESVESFLSDEEKHHKSKSWTYTPPA